MSIFFKPLMIKALLAIEQGADSNASIVELVPSCRVEDGPLEAWWSPEQLESSLLWFAVNNNAHQIVAQVLDWGATAEPRPNQPVNMFALATQHHIQFLDEILTQGHDPFDSLQERADTLASQEAALLATYQALHDHGVQCDPQTLRHQHDLVRPWYSDPRQCRDAIQPFAKIFKLASKRSPSSLQPYLTPILAKLLECGANPDLLIEDMFRSDRSRLHELFAPAHALLERNLLAQTIQSPDLGQSPRKM